MVLHLPFPREVANVEEATHGEGPGREGVASAGRIKDGEEEAERWRTAAQKKEEWRDAP